MVWVAGLALTDMVRYRNDLKLQGLDLTWVCNAGAWPTRKALMAVAHWLRNPALEVFQKPILKMNCIKYTIMNYTDFFCLSHCTLDNQAKTGYHTLNDLTKIIPLTPDTPSMSRCHDLLL